MVEWILKNATGQELDYLNSIGGSANLPILAKLLSKFKDYTVYEIFHYNQKDDHDLALFKTARVGEVAAFDAFLLSCQSAKSEITRRREAKEDGS